MGKALNFFITACTFVNESSAVLLLPSEVCVPNICQMNYSANIWGGMGMIGMYFIYVTTYGSFCDFKTRKVRNRKISGQMPWIRISVSWTHWVVFYLLSHITK